MGFNESEDISFRIPNVTAMLLDQSYTSWEESKLFLKDEFFSKLMNFHEGRGKLYKGTIERILGVARRARVEAMGRSSRDGAAVGSLCGVTSATLSVMTASFLAIGFLHTPLPPGSQT